MFLYCIFVLICIKLSKKMSCLIQCTPVLPVFPLGKCKTRPTKKGGICSFVFAKCAATIPTDPCNSAAWLALVNDCQLRKSPELVGSMSAAAFTSIRVSSCAPEIINSSTKTIAFKDFSSTLGLWEYVFWNEIFRQQGSLKIGWFDGEGNFYGFYLFKIEVSEVKDEISETGTSRFEGSIMIEEFEILQPVKVPQAFIDALDGHINYSCVTDDYMDDDSIACAHINLAPDARNKVGSIAGGVVGAVVDFTRVNCTDTPVSLSFQGLPLGTVVALTVTVLGSQTYTWTLPAGTAAGTYKVFVTGSVPSGCEVGSTFFLLTVS